MRIIFDVISPRRVYVLLFAVFIIEILCRFYQIAQRHEFHIDSYLRAYQALQMQRSGIFNTVSGLFIGKIPPFWLAWLPFPFILHALILYILPDPIISSVFISAISMFALLFVFIKFCEKLFNSAITSIIAILLFVTSSLNIFFSVQGLTQPLFSLLYIGGLYVLLYRNTLSLLLSSFLINLASLTRYESWPMALVVFPYVLLMKEKQTIYKILYLLSLCVGPLIWIWVNYRITGDWLHFYYEVKNNNIVVSQLAYFGVVINLLSSYINGFMPLGIYICVYGLIHNIRIFDRKMIIIYLVWLSLIINIVINVMRGVITFFPIYLFTSNILLIIIVLKTFEQLRLRIKYFYIVMAIYAGIYLIHQINNPYIGEYLQVANLQSSSSILRQYSGRTFIFDQSVEKEPLILASGINNYCLIECIDYGKAKIWEDDKKVVYIQSNLNRKSKTEHLNLNKVYSDNRVDIYIN